MKKEIKLLILIGIIFISIGLLFGLKNKFIDKNIEIIINNNSITYKNNNIKLKRNQKGKINLKIKTDKKGFYKIDLTQDKINIYSDNEYKNKQNIIYKIYDKPIIDEISIYYKNDNDKYTGDLKINVFYSETVETMINRSKIKDYFWSDEYRNLIEKIEFKNEKPICKNICFNLSNEIGQVYANLIPINDKYELEILSNDIIYLPVDSSYLFSNFENLKTINFNNISTKYVKNMDYMFYNDINLENLDLSNFETTNLDSIEGLLMDLKTINKVDLSTFKLDKINTNKLFMNINKEATIYVNSSVEQAWVFSPNNTNKPENWKVKNILVK